MSFVCSLLVLAIILLPKILIDISAAKAIFAEICGKPFVCPNCKNSFYAKKYKFLFNKTAVHTDGIAKLKCPSCGITDMCRHGDK